MSLAVLQINTLGKTLSTGRTTRELHEYLENHGEKSYIACPYKIDCEDIFEFSSLNYVHLDVLLSLVTGFEGNHSTIPTLRLINYIKKIKPSIVHLRVIHCNCINLKLLCEFLGKEDIPTVVTMHDMWYITGGCPFYSAIGCEKWKTGCGNCPNLKMGKRTPLLDRTNAMWRYKRNSLALIPRLAVVGVSHWSTNEVKQSFLQNARIIRTIYNWIDLDVFYPRKEKKINFNNKKIILSVAASWSVHDRKGFDYIIKLSKILPNQYIIVLVGNIKYNGKLPENIFNIDRTNSVDDLASYYSAANVYLNLSEEESFGKVSAESLSCGTPLISYNSTANAELVPENGGVLIDDREPETVLRAIIQVCAESKEKYIQVCRKFAIENFERETNIKQYINVYNELINMLKVRS